MTRFQDRHILVVGAYSGIGRAVARRLAEEGAAIVAVGRDSVKLRESVQNMPGDNHRAVTADAAKWEELQEIIEIGKKVGGYAGGVVCAGLHEARPLAVLDAAALARAFEANVTTALLATRALAKVARKDGCAMVWISSVAALRGTAAFGAYSASKGALISAARVAAVELASRRVRVNVIAAGVVRTAMSDKWLSMLNAQQQEAVAKSHPLGVGTPEDVAGPIAFLLSDDARWMTGSLMTVDGGLSAQ